MSMSHVLKHFVTDLALTAPECTYLPASETWEEHVARVSVPRCIAEVTEEQYLYWLEVLPPKFMSGNLFAFAEGAEPLRVFWKDRDGSYWMRQLTWDETTTFCRLAGLPTPN